MLRACYLRLQELADRALLASRVDVVVAAHAHLQERESAAGLTLSRYKDGKTWAFESQLTHIPVCLTSSLVKTRQEPSSGA